MSLRNRIAFYYTITTAFLIALVFAILYFMVESIVYKQFDEEINNEVTELFTDAHATSHDFTSFSRFKTFIDDNIEVKIDPKEAVKVDTEFIQLVNTEGEVINKSINLARNVLIFKPGETTMIYFNSTINNSAIRQGQLPLFNRDGIIKGYLIIAVPMKKAIIVIAGFLISTLISFSQKNEILKFFVEAGLLTDLLLNWGEMSAPLDTQSGIGLALGIGYYYNYKKLALSINPFLNYHAIIFCPHYNHDKLCEIGIKLGIGLNY